MPPNLPSYLGNDAFIGRCRPATGGSLFVRLLGLRSHSGRAKTMTNTASAPIARHGLFVVMVYLLVYDSSI